jgi:hypothetical protein
MADEFRPARTEAPTPPPAPPSLSDQGPLHTIYANFVRVSAMPEELVLDFGLNTQMQAGSAEAVKQTHRVVMSYYTAKRLMSTLLSVLNQFENTYGVLELDPQRRIRGGVRPPSGGLRPPGQG